MYPNPLSQTDIVLSEALYIAMDYLQRTGKAEDYRNVEARAMGTMLEAYRNGVRHRIALANKAIVAIERKPEPEGEIMSLYPRVC